MVLLLGTQAFKSNRHICHIKGVGTTPREKTSNSGDTLMSLGIRKYVVLGWGSQPFKSNKQICHIEGVGPLCHVSWDKKIYGSRVGILTVLE